MGKKKRVFSEEKLKEFSKDFMGLAMEALDAGDIERAKYWIRRQDQTKDTLHDLYLHWVTALLDRIYKRWGEDEVVESLRETVRQWVVPFARLKAQLLEKGGIAAYMEFLIDALRQHSMYPNLTVQEDDEKFILTMQPCGSGGRLIDSGAYEGPLGYAKLEKAGPHTWGETGVPIYCAHCPWAQEILPVSEVGEGMQLWVHASPFPKKPGDPCVQYVYKEARHVPHRFYERIGMSRAPRRLPVTYGIDPAKDAAAKKPVRK